MQIRTIQPKKLNITKYLFYLLLILKYFALNVFLEIFKKIFLKIFRPR